jgi:hypothetical protein
MSAIGRGSIPRRRIGVEDNVEKALGDGLGDF